MMVEAPAVLVGRGCRLELRLPAIMGVLNVTPDSFSDGGCYQAPDAALQQALRMEQAGAAVIDIGGESTRPGAELISAAEEIERVVPVIERIRQETDLPLSIDTNKAEVARAAILAGANFINDISGLTFDPQMARAASETGAGLVVMHTRGTPAQMQSNTEYADLCGEVLAFLQHSLDLAAAAGIDKSRIAVDPGIGFGKSVIGNLELLGSLQRLRALGCPILLGTSRKSFIGKILDQQNPRERLSGTLATIALGVAQGAHIFRVHDVAPAREAALVAWAVRERELP